MKKGESYSYVKIHKYSEENDCEMIEYGEGLIGEDFIVLKVSGVSTISFVSTGYGSLGFIYECIYNV